MMDLNIWMLTDHCKNDNVEDGAVLSGDKCHWHTRGVAHNVYTWPASYKGVAKRREGGPDMFNEFQVGPTYQVYAAYTIRDKETEEVIASGGPTVSPFVLSVEMYGLGAMANLVLASTTFFAAAIF